jgi:hypothetical protein
MLELLTRNAAFRSRAHEITERYQYPSKSQIRYYTFDIFDILEYCSALLVLNRGEQARRVFVDALQRIESLFIDNKHRIFEESQHFENSDPQAIGIVCSVIDSCGFIAVLMKNTELIEAVNKSIVDGEFVSTEGDIVYDGTFRLIEYVIKLNNDIKEAEKFRVENWNDWVEFDEASDYDLNWKFFLPVENNNLNELLSVISHYNSDLTIKLNKGLLHPYNYRFSRNVLGFIEAVAMRMLKKQLQPDEHYPSLGIDKLL